MNKRILYININQKMVEYNLPAFNNRKGILSIDDHSGFGQILISYEVWDGEWHFLSNQYTRLSVNHQVVEDMILTEGLVMKGKIYKNGVRFQIMVRNLDKEQAVFAKYDIRNASGLVIGSGSGADIVLNEKYVSARHALMFRRGDRWFIQDTSSNGTFLNSERLLGESALNLYDTIYIVGYKIVFLGDILAINRAGSAFAKLRPVDPAEFAGTGTYEDNSLFSRSPRMIEPLDTDVIELETPPSPVRQNKTPLIFLLGPSLTMPIPILATVFFNVIVNSGQGVSALSYMGMAISVILFAVLGVIWTTRRNRYDREMAAENEKARVEAYTKYIDQNVQLIEMKQSKNMEILERTYKPSEGLIRELISDRTGLWNRNVNHADFLRVRLGAGNMESPNKIAVPKARFSVEQDELVAYPYDFLERFRYMPAAAKTIDLKNNKIIGVIGDPDALLNIANVMIIQLAALYSYTDVRMAFFLKEFGEQLRLTWAKWLPHTFSDDKKTRFLADREDAYRNTLYTLAGELRNRREPKITDKRYIIFCSDPAIFENDAIYKYMTDDKDYGFTFVLLYGEMDLLPNECKTIIECTNRFSGVYQLDEELTERNAVTFDRLTTGQAEFFARTISGYRVNELVEESIPESIDYFSMLGIRGIEEWDLRKRYKENRSYEGVRAWIGMGSGNKPMYLDIHEKKYGPHGLVAGTTGSGKSETLQTFILSLALNYHPDEVAFILIDYKGGGMANAFLGIPHLAGTITNLGGEGESGVESIDDNQTRRALISIRSEIKRRQTIFNKYKVNHIDAYTRLYREGKADEPLPRLIIISDEFAELKKEQPEFIKELVSTARVGRSLGIHLILATQKPSGVVDDEIWSNSRFKLCLRVQDRQDSMEMLKRPDAAFLTRTGRAYLQIGNDELFEQFQTAYSGAAYEPAEDGEEASEDIEMIDLDGTPSTTGSDRRAASEDASSQLSVCVDYITRTAEKLGIHATRPLWLPQLPRTLALEELEERFEVDYERGTAAVVGLVDEPEKQAQYPLVIYIEKLNNLIVAGSAGCGKTTFLQTLTLSLITRYTPEQVEIYCMDFSSGTLRPFEKAPQVGGVVLSDEAEKTRRLFRMLEEALTERKELFSKAGVGNFEEYRKINDDLPLLVWIIDNYFGFAEIYGDLEESFQKLTRDGVKYGLQTIITCNHLNDARYKIRQNFSRVIPIQMKEKGDYMDVFGKTPPILPSRQKGRGLVMLSDILEFQAALPAKGESETERGKAIVRRIAEVKERVGSKQAKPIPVLPRERTYQQLLADFLENSAEKGGSLPLGYDVLSMEVYRLRLKETYCYAVGGAGMETIGRLLNETLYAASGMDIETHLVRLGTGAGGIREELAAGVYKSYEEVYHLLLRLKREFTQRSDAYKEAAAAKPDTDMDTFCAAEYGRIIVLIDDMGAFEDLIYNAENKESMKEIVTLFFEKGASRGICFMAGYPVGMEPNKLYLPASKAFLKYRTGIHIGGRVSEQRILELSLPLAKQNERLPDNVGYASDHGMARQIYLPDKLGEEDGWI